MTKHELESATDALDNLPLYYNDRERQKRFDLSINYYSYKIKKTHYDSEPSTHKIYVFLISALYSLFMVVLVTFISSCILLIQSNQISNIVDIDLDLLLSNYLFGTETLLVQQTLALGTYTFILLLLILAMICTFSIPISIALSYNFVHLIDEQIRKVCVEEYVNVLHEITEDTYLNKIDIRLLNIYLNNKVRHRFLNIQTSLKSLFSGTVLITIASIFIKLISNIFIAPIDKIVTVLIFFEILFCIFLIIFYVAIMLVYRFNGSNNKVASWDFFPIFRVQRRLSKYLFVSNPLNHLDATKVYSFAPDMQASNFELNLYAQEIEEIKKRKHVVESAKGN